jgi:uncharacterized protein (TIGR00269 family)
MNLLRGDVSRLGRCVAITTGTRASAPAADEIAVTPGATGPDSVVSTPGAISSAASTPATPLRSVPRCKPLKWAYEKEIVLYAYHKRLDYHSTECVYSPHAYRGFAREFLKDLEAIRPRAIVDIIQSAEAWRIDEETEARGGTEDSASVRTSATAASSAKLTTRAQTMSTCVRCGYMTSRSGGGGDDCSDVQSCGGVVERPSAVGAGARGVSGPGPLCQACTLLAGLAAGAPRMGVVSERQARRMRADAAAATATTAPVPAPAVAAVGLQPSSTSDMGGSGPS